MCLKLCGFAFISLFICNVLPTTEAAGTWIYRGTNPYAARQSTVGGKALRSMIGWTGATTTENPKLYSGFGDYSANTGPITIASFDTSTCTFSAEWNSSTEAIYNFRPMLGRLYVPAIDPRTAAGFSLLTPNGIWRDYNVFMEHGFDMITRDGTDLFLVGSGGDHLSRCLISKDLGKTWAVSLIVTYLNDDYSRFYWSGVLNGKLYIQSSTNATKIHVFDGSTWREMNFGIAQYGGRPIQFENKLIIQNGVAGSCGYLLVFDGTHSPVRDNSVGYVCGFDIYDEKLCVYDGSTNKILCKQTLNSNWTAIAENVPSTTTSWTILEGKIYIGLSNSTICEYSVPFYTRPSVVVVAIDDTANLSKEKSAAIIIRRSGSTTSPLTIKYSTNGPAINGIDYSLLDGTITIPSGSKTVTLSISPVDNGIVKPLRYLILKLASDSSYVVGNPDNTLISIIDGRNQSYFPVRSNGKPNGNLAYGTQQTELSLQTSSISICHFATSANISFDAMISNFTTTNGLYHTTIVTGLSSGNNYQYFIRCRNAGGKTNLDDFVISFYVSNKQDDEKTISDSSKLFINLVSFVILFISTNNI